MADVGETKLKVFHDVPKRKVVERADGVFLLFELAYVDGVGAEYHLAGKTKNKKIVKEWQT